MRVVATLINGLVGRANRNNLDDAIHLPMSMGYLVCYQQYMASLGYDVRTTGAGTIIVEQRDCDKVDLDDFVSFPMYYYR